VRLCFIADGLRVIRKPPDEKSISETKEQLHRNAESVPAVGEFSAVSTGLN